MTKFKKASASSPKN